jgi:hypothetical protein
MKKSLTILTAFLLSTQFVSAQKIDTATSRSPQENYNFYMQKNRTNKTIGWCLLGSGIVAMTIGTSEAMKHLFDTHDHRGEALGLAGFGASLVSIPFFLAAGDNKRAARLSVKQESTSMGGGGPNNFGYTAVSLKISF